MARAHCHKCLISIIKVSDTQYHPSAAEAKRDDGFINLSGRLCNWWAVLGQVNHIDPCLVQDENTMMLLMHV